MKRLKIVFSAAAVTHKTKSCRHTRLAGFSFSIFYLEAGKSSFAIPIAS